MHLTLAIMSKTFPCIMAKAVQKAGLFQVVSLDSNTEPKTNVKIVMKQLEAFLVKYREKPNRLSSFILSFKESKLGFDEFESYFWNLLAALRIFDKGRFKYDERVSSNPRDPHFSYSLQKEAFFILMLHPDSPRFARQTTPTIVFNPHQQFEKLRKNGTYMKVRNMIRKRDVSLQGSINPTLKDFGVDSEILQYTGTEYDSIDKISNYV